MKKKSKAVLKVDPYLEGLMSKLLDRLMSLDKKMDAVLARTAAGSSNGQPKSEAPRRERVLYEAICADCHKVCEVPFKPSEDRAVYCKQCFAKRKSGGPGQNIPVLTPVALPPKPASKLSAAALSALATSASKMKKSRPAKKTKKKK